jgi:hypothetical protein
MYFQGDIVNEPSNPIGEREPTTDHLYTKTKTCCIGCLELVTWVSQRLWLVPALGKVVGTGRYRQDRNRVDEIEKGRQLCSCSFGTMRKRGQDHKAGHIVSLRGSITGDRLGSLKSDLQ